MSVAFGVYESSTKGIKGIGSRCVSIMTHVDNDVYETT